MGLILKPGTDGALACAVMHVLFRDGLADRAYLEKYTDDPKGLGSASAATRRRNGRPRSPACRSPRSRPSRGWSARRSAPSSASATALPASATARSTCMRRCRSPAVTGCWQYEGGGAFHSNSGIFKLDKDLLEGDRLRDPDIRYLDHSRIGPVLIGAAGCALRRAAGDGDADPEHQSGQCRAGAAAGEAGFPARRPVHLRARAVHDRYGEARRCRAAGDDVPGARRHLRAAATSTSRSGRS